MKKTGALLGALLGLLSGNKVEATEAPQVGKPAPDFTAACTDGRTVSLKDFHGKWLALYFYPKAFTPGCTKESCNLRDGYHELKKKNVVVLGVSLDDLETQKKFKEKYSLPFELLADNQKTIARAYDTLAIGGLFTKRHTFLIDPQGKLAVIITEVMTGSHDQQILKALQQAEKGFSKKY